MVFDPSGAPVSGAQVTFDGEKNVTANTVQNGSVQVLVPRGTYIVTITSPGFKTAKIAGFSVAEDNAPALNVRLQLSPGIGDCFPCEEQPVQTITSDLPNVIEPNLNRGSRGGDLGLIELPTHTNALAEPHPSALYPNPFRFSYPRTSQMATISDIGKTEVLPGKTKIEVKFLSDDHWAYVCSVPPENYNYLRKGDRVSIRPDKTSVHLKVRGRPLSLRIIDADRWGNL